MQSEVKVRKKMPNVSLRIDEETISLLRDLAVAENIALNAVVNRILKEYVHVTVKAKQIDSKLVIGGFLQKIIELGETDKLAAISRDVGKNTFKMLNESTLRPRDLTTFRGVLRDTFCYSANWAKYSEDRHGSRVAMNLTHRMGLKWSEILKNFFYWEITQLENVKIADVNFVCLEDALVISFPDAA